MYEWVRGTSQDKMYGLAKPVLHASTEFILIIIYYYYYYYIFLYYYYSHQYIKQWGGEGILSLTIYFFIDLLLLLLTIY